MRIWFVFELLIFFVLLAFASSRSVQGNPRQEAEAVQAVVETGATEVVTEAIAAAVEEALTNVTAAVTEAAVVEEAEEPTTEATGPARFCKCVALECNCCREFRLPVLPISSSGCASLRYLKKDKMALTMRLGDTVLRNITVSSRNSKPACVNLPGGFSQFCGRVYGISRSGEDFKACLALELRALADLEASMRVSCFRFSPKGVTLEAAPPLPTSAPAAEEDEDEEEEEEEEGGLFGFGGDDDDDDEDDDDDFEYAADEADEADEADNDVSEGDYGGFSALGGLFGGLFDDDTPAPPQKKKKPVVPTVAPVAAIKRPVKPVVANDKIDTVEETPKPMPIKVTTKIPEASTTAKPPKRRDATTLKPVTKVESTTEKRPTTIVLSPTSSVKISTTSTTQKAVVTSTTTQKSIIPDPVKPESAEKKPAEEEADSDENDEDEDELDLEFEDNETDTSGEEADDTFSSELVDAIKGVQEELSSVADIVDEPENEEAESAEENEEEESGTVNPSTESPDEEDELDIDILDEVEQLADEVSASVVDKKPQQPQGGVPLDGEPRANSTTTVKTPVTVGSTTTVKTPSSTEDSAKLMPTLLKRNHRVSRHHAV